MNSGLPPSRMSVPRPAMLVETVTAPLRPGLRHDGGFALVILGVQDLVPHAHALQNGGEPLRFLHRNRAHQNRLAGGVDGLDLLGRVAEFLFLGAVNDVLIFLADQRPVGGNHRDFELVNLLEFRRFGFRRTGHAGELLVHAEIVLEGDGGERLVLALDAHAFLGFHGLVQPVAPAPARHQAAGELVDDDDFGPFVAIPHHVFAVALVEHVRAQGLLHVVVAFDVGGVVQIGQAEQLFHLEHALFGERRGVVLLVDGVVAGGVFFARLPAFDHFAAHQLGDDAVDLVILVGGFLARARK